MNLDIEFRNAQQRDFFWSRARNNCFSGGFNNGKSFIGCLRHFTLLSMFPGYKTVIAREVYKDLRATTMATFFKICPDEFIETHDVQSGVTVLKNGSQVLWMHLDAFDEMHQSLRGLEINSALIDQAEEVQENVFLVLDSRIGRWDKAEVPAHLVAEYEIQTGLKWPIDTRSKKPLAPSYFDILCNPDTRFHWIFRRFHPESLEKRANYFYIEAQTDISLGDPETMAEMQNRDEEWVNKYFKGIWGASAAQVHDLRKDSILDPDQPEVAEFLKKLLENASLYRTFDHGDSSPSCCLWAAAWRGVYVFFREYYVPNEVISRHRQNIHDLSGDEIYVSDFADPSIFNKNSQKKGGFWSVADEYSTGDISAPPIFWQPADNNELATRNRINELLRPQDRFKHPITGTFPAPGMYFVKRTASYPYGCFQSILQIQSQRREAIGSENGRTVYSDERDDAITDHAYDPVRYFVAMHGVDPRIHKPTPKRNTFAHFNNLLKRQQAPTAGSV